MDGWIIKSAIFVLHLLRWFQADLRRSQAPLRASAEWPGFDWQLAFLSCLSLTLSLLLTLSHSPSMQPSCHSDGFSTNSPLSSRWTSGALSPRRQGTSTSPRWTPRTAATTPASPPALPFPKAFSPTTFHWCLRLNVSTYFYTPPCFFTVHNDASLLGFTVRLEKK